MIGEMKVWKLNEKYVVNKDLFVENEDVWTRRGLNRKLKNIFAYRTVTI